MHSTLVSGWSLTNIGPLTTTYTAPSSCSTNSDLAYVQIGLSYVDSGTNNTLLLPVGAACGEPDPTLGSCLPSGAKLDADYSAIDTNKVGAGWYTLGYYSPGLMCPSGWDTVGVATKTEGGSITSSGPGFVNPSPTDFDYDYFENVAPNVLLAGMDEGDAAVLCCPSSYVPDVGGTCSSIVSSYRVPTEYCIRVIGGEGDEVDMQTVNSTFSIWGTTVTRSAVIYPTSQTATISTETTSLDQPTQSYVGVSIVEMLYLVHSATETASGSSSATSSSSLSSAASMNARSPQLASAALIVLTLAAALTSGFTFLTT